MDETIISINSANIISIALMIVIILTIFYMVGMALGKMRGANND